MLTLNLQRRVRCSPAHPKTLILALALFCTATAPAAELDGYKSATAAYDAYCRVYEQNDPDALNVYSEEGVIRFLDRKSGRSTAMALGMYKNLIRSMIPGARAKGEYVVFSKEPEGAQTGEFHTWRGWRTTYPGVTTVRYIIDIRRNRDGSFQVAREVLQTP